MEIQPTMHKRNILWMIRLRAIKLNNLIRLAVGVGMPLQLGATTLVSLDSFLMCPGPEIGFWNILLCLAAGFLIESLSSIWLMSKDKMVMKNVVWRKKSDKSPMMASWQNSCRTKKNYAAANIDENFKKVVLLVQWHQWCRARI